MLCLLLVIAAATLFAGCGSNSSWVKPCDCSMRIIMEVPADTAAESVAVEVGRIEADGTVTSAAVAQVELEPVEDGSLLRGTCDVDGLEDGATYRVDAVAFSEGRSSAKVAAASTESAAGGVVLISLVTD